MQLQKLSKDNLAMTVSNGRLEQSGCYILDLTDHNSSHVLVGKIYNFSRNQISNLPYLRKELDFGLSRVSFYFHGFDLTQQRCLKLLNGSPEKYQIVSTVSIKLSIRFTWYNINDGQCTPQQLVMDIRFQWKQTLKAEQQTPAPENVTASLRSYWDRKYNFRTFQTYNAFQQRAILQIKKLRDKGPYRCNDNVASFNFANLTGQELNTGRFGNHWAVLRSKLPARHERSACKADFLGRGILGKPTECLRFKALRYQP